MEDMRRTTEDVDKKSSQCASRAEVERERRKKIHVDHREAQRSNKESSNQPVPQHTEALTRRSGVKRGGTLWKEEVRRRTEGVDRESSQSGSRVEA